MYLGDRPERPGARAQFFSTGVKSPIGSNSRADEHIELTVQPQTLTLGPGSVSRTRRHRRAESGMTRRRAQVEKLRRFLLDRVAMSPAGVAQAAAERFEMTPQAMNWHLRRLCKEGLIERHGNTRRIRYRLATLSQWTRSYSIGRDPAEDVIWHRDVRGGRWRVAGQHRGYLALRVHGDVQQRRGAFRWHPVLSLTLLDQHDRDFSHILS